METRDTHTETDTQRREIHIHGDMYAQRQIYRHREK